MAMTVIDLLEAVEVEIEQGERPVRAGGGDRPLRVAEDAEPVRQAGERVVAGAVAVLALGHHAGEQDAMELEGRHGHGDEQGGRLHRRDEQDRIARGQRSGRRRDQGAADDGGGEAGAQT